MNKINVAPCKIQGKRDYQQDDLGYRDIAGNSKLVYLADGMGGYKGGEKASELVIKTFSQSSSDSNDGGVFLKKLLEKSNKAIESYKEEHPDVSQMGTTLVAMLITENTCQWISVGDSLLYHIRGNKIKRINANHSVAGLLELQLKKGEVTQEEVDNNPNKHMLTSALTGDEISIIDLSKKIKIKPDDIFVLASDGVETISERDILRIITGASGDMDVAAKRVLGEVEKLDKVNQDNATIMIVSQSQGSELESISKIAGISSDETNINIPKREVLSIEIREKIFFTPWIVGFLGLFILVAGVFIEKKFNVIDSMFPSIDSNSSLENENNISTLMHDVIQVKDRLRNKTKQLGNKNLERELNKTLNVRCIGKNKNVVCMLDQIKILSKIEIVIDKQLKVQSKIEKFSKRTVDKNTTKLLNDLNSTLINETGDINVTVYDNNLTGIEKFIEKEELVINKKRLKIKIIHLKKDKDYKIIIEGIKKSKNEVKKEALLELPKIEIALKDVNSSREFMNLENALNQYMEDINCTKFVKGDEQKDLKAEELKKKTVVKS